MLEGLKVDIEIQNCLQNRKNETDQIIVDYHLRATYTPALTPGRHWEVRETYSSVGRVPGEK